MCMTIRGGRWAGHVSPWGSDTDGSAGMGHVVKDGCHDPVPALGSVPTAPAEGRCAAVGSELAVAADRVAADEVTEQEEVSRSRCKL